MSWELVVRVCGVSPADGRTGAGEPPCHLDDKSRIISGPPHITFEDLPLPSANGSTNPTAIVFEKVTVRREIDRRRSLDFHSELTPVQQGVRQGTERRDGGRRQLGGGEPGTS